MNPQHIPGMGAEVCDAGLLTAAYHNSSDHILAGSGSRYTDAADAQNESLLLDGTKN
jgi:hypothetical protein